MAVAGYDAASASTPIAGGSDATSTVRPAAAPPGHVHAFAPPTTPPMTHTTHTDTAISDGCESNARSAAPPRPGAWFAYPGRPYVAEVWHDPVALPPAHTRQWQAAPTRTPYSFLFVRWRQRAASGGARGKWTAAKDAVNVVVVMAPEHLLLVTPAKGQVVRVVAYEDIRAVAVREPRGHGGGSKSTASSAPASAPRLPDVVVQTTYRHDGDDLVWLSVPANAAAVGGGTSVRPRRDADCEGSAAGCDAARASRASLQLINALAFLHERRCGRAVRLWVARGGTDAAFLADLRTGVYVPRGALGGDGDVGATHPARGRRDDHTSAQKKGKNDIAGTPISEIESDGDDSVASHSSAGGGLDDAVLPEYGNVLVRTSPERAWRRRLSPPPPGAQPKYQAVLDSIRRNPPQPASTTAAGAPLLPHRAFAIPERIPFATRDGRRSYAARGSPVRRRSRSRSRPRRPSPSRSPERRRREAKRQSVADFINGRGVGRRMEPTAGAVGEPAAAGAGNAQRGTPDGDGVTRFPKYPDGILRPRESSDASVPPPPASPLLGSPGGSGTASPPHSEGRPSRSGSPARGNLPYTHTGVAVGLPSNMDTLRVVDDPEGVSGAGEGLPVDHGTPYAAPVDTGTDVNAVMELPPPARPERDAATPEPSRPPATPTAAPPDVIRSSSDLRALRQDVVAVQPPTPVASGRPADTQAPALAVPARAELVDGLD